MRSLVALALASAAVAQPPPPGATWYGIAPDTTIPGQVNIFTMTPTGAPINGVASIVTPGEYPKTGTFHCAWGSPMCYFATGVGGPYTQDAVYGVNRTSGQVVFKHELPAGIYIDNLAYDYLADNLYSIGFDPQDRTARLVSYDGTTGAPTILSDISQDIAGGFVFGGDVTICPSTKTLYVGVNVGVADGAFGDFLLSYSYASNPPKLVTRQPVLFPLPTGLHAFCNATALQALTAAYIQADDIGRETLVLANVLTGGREGFAFPIARGDLPTFSQRGAIPLFLNDMSSEHAGTFITTIYPPFQPGPGPAPQLQGGLVFTWQFTENPTPGALGPIGYFLAGASGVPGR